jgi:hypothetical protein
LKVSFSHPPPQLWACPIWFEVNSCNAISTKKNFKKKKKFLQSVN